MYRFFNPNPSAARVGDCAVRAVSKATGQSWETTFLDLALYGFMLNDMPSANAVWGRYLYDRGFRKHLAENDSVKDFAKNHRSGVYVLALSGHTVAVQNGDYYDSWDSGDEIPLYYWRKE